MRVQTKNMNRRAMEDDVEVVGTGFAVLDRIYVDDAEAFEELGGSCGNVLISLAMLRRNVAPVLRLGMDDVGDRMIYEFETAGADTRFIRLEREVRTPVLVQTLDTSSGRSQKQN